jgi:hypothetical protein
MIRRTFLAASVVALALLAGATTASADLPQVAPDVTKLAIAPTAFKALPTGTEVVTAGGAQVTFHIADGAFIDFVVKAERPGRRSGRTCVAGTPKTKAGSCVRTLAVPGTFKLVGISGDNDFRFSGRIGDKTLAPGRYRLIAQAEGAAARSSFVSFKITR